MPAITGTNNVQYEVSPRHQCFSTRAGAAQTNTAIEQNLITAAKAIIRNSGWRSTVNEVDTRLRRLNGVRAATGCVSGSCHQAETANTRPHNTMNANTARQPK